MSEDKQGELRKGPEQVQRNFIEVLTQKFENASSPEKDLEYKIDQEHLFCIFRHTTQRFSEVYRSYYSGEDFDLLVPSEEFVEVSALDDEGSQVLRRIVTKQSGRGRDWTQLVFEKDMFEISTNVRREDSEDQDISIQYDDGTLVLLSSSGIIEIAENEPYNDYWKCETSKLNGDFEHLLENGRVVVRKERDDRVRVEVFNNEISQGGFVIPEKIDVERIQDHLLPESLLEEPYEAPREDDNSWLHANLLRACGVERLYSDEADRRFVGKEDT